MLQNTSAFRARIARETCAELAGPLFEAMTTSLETAERYLRSSDPRNRLAALFIIRYCWTLTPAFAEQCERMALEDCDEKVRSAALLFLATYYRDTTDRRVGKFVAELLCDAKQPLELRRVAYSSLFLIRGILTVSDLSSDFRFPDNVDWSFVSTFL